jgi:hypothetical protein
MLDNGYEHYIVRYLGLGRAEMTEATGRAMSIA